MWCSVTLLNIFEFSVQNCSNCLTKFSTNNTAYNEERSEELEGSYVSPEDELVGAGRYDRPEADEDHPDWGWDKDQPRPVDVVVDGVDDGGEEELERSSD